jgi:hypothetical protein
MANRFLPPRLDNDYRGHRLALWLFGLLVFMKTAMSVSSIFNGYSVATSADGIPLDTFGPAGSRAFVASFAILGLSQLMICLLGILALVRYRSMIPLLFGVFLLEFLGRRLIFYFLPVARTGTPPGSTINLVLLALMVVGLAFSLWSREKAPAVR